MRDFCVTVIYITLGYVCCDLGWSAIKVIIKEWRDRNNG